MSTQEYTKATAKIPGRKLPIIVLPGIMGSRLTEPSTKKLVWNPTGFLPSEPGSFAANFDRLRRVDEPLEPDEDNKFPLIADRVRVDPIQHYYSVITNFYGSLAVSLHYDLRKPLAAKGLVPAVYCCGYDWRQDNAKSAARLSTIVEEARADCDNEQVILIAHSMGGIVARFYCKQLGGEAKVRAVFLLGSPTLGAVQSYHSMRDGLPFLDPIRRILNISADQSRLFMRNMQSVFQLLPNFIYCTEVRKSWASFDATKTGFSHKFFPGTPMQNPALMFADNANPALFYLDLYTGLTNDLRTRQDVIKQIGRTLAFGAELTLGNRIYMHPKTFSYFCESIDTQGSERVRFNGVTAAGDDIVVDSTLEEAPLVPGDKTVPADSANTVPVSNPLSERRNFSGVEHTKLSSDAGVITAVRERIVSIV